MSLDIQIITLLTSLLFGIIFGLIVDLINKKLFKLKKTIQIVLTGLLVIISALIYFIILLKLNNAIIHPYYALMLMCGYFIEHWLAKRIVLKFKK